MAINAWSIGLATGAYALSFGAISIASGLTWAQTQFLSLGMFTGASQFALVGVLGAGGGAGAAIITAVLLGLRNGFYGMSVAPLLHARSWRRPFAAQLTIDESTAMAISQPTPALARFAFWQTGLAVFVLWNIGTALGAWGASALDDPAVLGLDAAIPAGFVALLWPRLRTRGDQLLALIAAAVALLLVPIVPVGIPVLSAAFVAVIAERFFARRETA